MSSSSYAAKHKELGLCCNCPKPLISGSSTFCEYHREKDRIRRRVSEKKLALKLKKVYLQKYGKKCSSCGESKIEFLTLEHKAGEGNKHRIKLFKHNVGGVHMYRWLKRNNYPEEYSVLCMNCNWAKRYTGLCPHALER